MRFGFEGRVQVTVLPLTVNPRKWWRWSVLTWWVTEPGRTRDTLLMLAASALVRVNVFPGDAEASMAETVGRGPLKRYGGLKTSAVFAYVPFVPPDHTRPSGSSSAVEWYMRTPSWLAMTDHVPVAGS